MRVLWFTNTPSLGSSYLGSKRIGGTWIESLENELTSRPFIQLGITFKLTNSDVKPFTINSTRYYPVNIKLPVNKFRKTASRWTHKIDNEDNIQSYLDIIDDFKPDLINIFGTEGDFGLVIPKTSIPCIIHFQGNLTVNNLKWYTGFTPYDLLRYSNKKILLKGEGLYHDYFISKKAAKRENKIFKDCRFFMGRTDWDKRLSSVLSPGSKYFHCDEIMRPGFYSNMWQPKKEKSAFNILSIFNKNIYKGLETIMESKKILKNNYPGHQIEWKIAGIKEQDEISCLVERKYKVKFKDQNIQLLGPLKENELIKEMLNADLFVHPSHIDNSPNSICEAMLLGMPVIGTFAGGIPSILESKKEGLLIQDGDPFSLAGAIIELIENFDYANNLGINARQKALDRHDPEKIVNNLLKIYSSII
jgi:glycosyltransferase involved in cell wall biosynthesis